MLYKLTVMTVSLALAANVFAAEHQDKQSAKQPTGIQREQQQETPELGEQQTERRWKGTNLIGSGIITREGEEMGQIDDLVINPQTGQVEYVVTSIGGWLGIGDRQLAVPFKSLERGTEHDGYYINVDRQKMRQAPTIEKDQETLEEQTEEFWKDLASWWDRNTDFD